MLVLLIAKVVDILLITGVKSYNDDFLANFNEKFAFGSVVRGLGIIRSYGMTIVENEDFSTSIHAAVKLDALECCPLSLVRRRHVDATVSEVEKLSFMSVRSSLGWLGIAASPLRAFYASHLKQMMPSLTVNQLLSHMKYHYLLKKCGTLTAYSPRSMSVSLPVSVLVISDTGRHQENGQLSFIAGLRIGLFAQYSLFYTLSWSGHESKSPVKSIRAAEILAASEAIDNGKVLKRSMALLLRKKVPLLITLYYRDFALLCLHIATQLKSIYETMSMLFATNLKRSMSTR